MAHCDITSRLYVDTFAADAQEIAGRWGFGLEILDSFLLPRGSMIRVT